jgi:murein DD-endopeptidase MepM/ murein hydrolase activator NlpD
MSDKAPDQLKREIEQREKPGEFNSLDRGTDAISDNASIGVDSIEQYTLIANRVISDSKVEKSLKRESRLISTTSLNDYEAFVKSLSDPAGRNLKSVSQNTKKLLTRCAEGPEATADLPLYFDQSDPTQKAAKKFMLHLHPSEIISSSDVSKNNFRTGAIVNQTYKDNNRNSIQIESVKSKSFPINNNLTLERPTGGSISAFTSGSPINGVSYVESNSSVMPVAPEASLDIVKIKEEKIWSPKFSPLAVGSSKYTKIVVGSKFGPRPNPFGGSTPGFHSGIDMWVRALGPITAIDDGVVSSVSTPQRDVAMRSKSEKGKPLGHTTKGGATVIIYHDSSDNNIKFRSGYCHMMKIIVKKGQKVKAGEIIGFVGGGVYGYTSPNEKYDPPAKRFYCSWPGGGGSTGPHLHFSLSKVVNGKKTKVDPLMFEYPNATTISDEQYNKYIVENTKYINAKKKELVSLHEKVTGKKLKPKG